MALDSNHYVINDTTAYPYAAIVYILSTFPDGTRTQGSGVLVGVNDVLTASHVVYRKSNGGQAIATEIIPAYNGTDKPLGSYEGGEIHCNTLDNPDNQIGSNEVPMDYALISLKTALGLKTGFFGLDPNFFSKTAAITAYPQLQKGQRIHSEAETALKTFDNGSNYLDITKFYVASGSSGGPVYALKNGRPYTIGVVSTVKWSAPIIDSPKVKAYSNIVNFINADHQYVSKALPILNVANQTVAAKPAVNQVLNYQLDASFPVPVTSEVTVATQSGSAVSGVDFDAYQGNVAIEANAASASFNVNIHPDWKAHPGVNKLNFYLTFSNPTVGMFAKSYSSSRVAVTITKEEAPQMIAKTPAAKNRQLARINLSSAE